MPSSRLISELKQVPEFVKISHSVFALPFALSSLLLASHGWPNLQKLSLVVAAVVSARLAAMAFNRLVDARIDASNPRTAMRHIPSGAISPSTAIAVILVGVGLFVWISFSINSLAGKLSPVALLVILGYSFTKRFTALSHFVLGAALGLAPLGAWVAARGELGSPTPWLLAVAVLCWVAGFDMIYAMQDEDYDRTHGLRSMVVVLGAERALRLVRLLHCTMFLLLVAVGIHRQMGSLYYAGLSIVLASLLWEQWLMRGLGGEGGDGSQETESESQKMEEKRQANLQIAFLQANGIASFGYLLATFLGLWL